LSVLSFLTGGWKACLASAALSAVLAGGVAWYATSLPYKAEIANMKAAQAQSIAANAQAALKQYAGDAATINAAANGLIAIEQGLNSKFGSLTLDLASHEKAVPLPADCKPDAFRLRVLSDAVAAANAAAAGREVSAGLPANP
jgi:hypothetical protein